MRKESVRYSWGEIDPNYGGLALKWSAWNEDHDTICIGLILCTIYLNFKKTIRRNNKSSLEQPSYGFNFFERTVHVHWGEKYKILHMPWDWEFYARWEQVKLRHWTKKDGEESPEYAWVKLPYYGFDHGNVAEKYTAYYTHTLNSGALQSTIATYYVDKMEWRWKWFQYLPWPRKVRVYIDVTFKNEMGERAGSWKGGTTGCSYEMKPGESPEETLRRMEKERNL